MLIKRKRRWRLLSEHAGPKLNELSLVEAAVLVLIKHLDQVSSHAVIEPETISYNDGHFVRAQNTVTVLVELVETGRYVLVTKYSKYICRVTQ